MAIALRVVGGAMLVYTVLYTAQFLFSTLYDEPQRVWDVFNVISAVGILLALVANLAHLREQSADGALTAARAGAVALFYANAALAVWFFRNWIQLLDLEEGESVSIHADVIWDFVAVLIPLVLATTGWRLWRTRA